MLILLGLWCSSSSCHSTNPTSTTMNYINFNAHNYQNSNFSEPNSTKTKTSQPQKLCCATLTQRLSQRGTFSNEKCGRMMKTVAMGRNWRHPQRKIKWTEQVQGRQLVSNVMQCSWCWEGFLAQDPHHMEAKKTWKRSVKMLKKRKRREPALPKARKKPKNTKESPSSILLYNNVIQYLMLLTALLFFSFNT